VERAIKGGFEVRIGRTRAFCPFSQMDLSRVDAPDQYLGRSLHFAVIQFRRGGEDVVLSRRAVLERDRSDEAKAVRATLLEGAVMWGRVVSVAEFGAFVDLGAGVTGLVHVSEVGHARISRVSDAVSVGDSVHVKILKLDDERGRISLSIKQTAKDPWTEHIGRFGVGSQYPGRVVRIVDFGAFVELAPGLEVLAPARDFPPTPSGWPHGLEPGMERSWLLTGVDAEKRRATVVPAPEAGTSVESLKVEPGAMLTGRVQRVERFGVFVWLTHGRVGLLPAALSGVPRGSDLSRAFPVGKEIEVEVADVSGDRIRLGVKGAAQAAASASERKPARSAARPPRAPSRMAPSHPPPRQAPVAAFANSLADALKAALEKPR
jgi:small subunit ribosomal protein S1